MSYITTKFKISLKIALEYKTNMYAGLIVTTLFTILTTFVLFVINNNFNILTEWTRNEYLVYVTFLQGIGIFFGTLAFNNTLSRKLLSGHINNYLTKPLNIFKQYLMDTLLIETIFIGIIYIILIPIIAPKNLNLLIGLTIAILGGILEVIIMKMMDSFAFFMKSNRPLFKLVESGEVTFRQYPASMFKNNVKYITYLFPITFFASIPTQITFGKLTGNQIINITIILISLITITSIITYTNWHYGLKRYEAFG